MTSKAKAPIPSPEQFFNDVTQLNDKKAVHKACNELLDLLSENYAVSTISTKLTPYKKLFYNYQHTNPELNEEVKGKIQHIAGKLLNLTDEQSQKLENEREEKRNSSAGFDGDGEYRNIQKNPMDITEVIKKACGYLNSQDPYTISTGILLLTGLRQSEQSQLKRLDEETNTIIEREMIAIGEYLIAFKGVTKKRNFTDKETWFIRPTLAPAQMIVDAQKRFALSPKIQAIPVEYQRYEDCTFARQLRRKFKDLMGTDLATIAAYDNVGRLINSDASPHKARAFYACALRAIYQSNGMRETSVIRLIKKSLVHENESETTKYLGKYSTDEFINAPSIELPTNYNDLGAKKEIMITAIKEAQQATKEAKKSEAKPALSTGLQPSTKATAKQSKLTINLEELLDGLSEDEQIKVGKMLSEKISVTTIILNLIADAKKSSKSMNKEQKPKRKSVTEKINEIAKAILTFNMRVSEEQKPVVPTYGLINKISKRLPGETPSAEIAGSTFDAWLKANKNDLDKELLNAGIPIVNDTAGKWDTNGETVKWNGKYYRRTIDDVIDQILEILKEISTDD
jgi:hypothetical protein